MGVGFPSSTLMRQARSKAQAAKLATKKNGDIKMEQMTRRDCQRIRKLISRMAGTRNIRLPIDVDDNDTSAYPHMAGESWHYETRGGNRIHHPNAYAKTGWRNMVYVPGNKHVEVGARWLEHFTGTAFVILIGL